MDHFEFISTEYCGFCRLQFPIARLQGVNAWQSEFRSVLQLESSDDRSIRMTSLATFSSDYEEIEVGLGDHDLHKTVNIIPFLRSSRGRGNQTAFCFHDWCYENLIRNSEGCTETVIYELLQALDVDISLYGNAHAGGDQLDPGGRLRALASHFDRQPLSSMNELPYEIRCSIWDHTGLATAYSSAILASKSARLICAMCGPSQRNIPVSKGRYSVKMISIFGRKYIQDLWAHSEGEYVVFGIVTGLQFAFLFGGLCAIKVFGMDWDSGWLGHLPQTSHVWYGMISGTLTNINCVYNGLCCTRITDSESYSASQIMWDRPDIPSSLADPNPALLTSGQNTLESVRPYNTDCRRFFRYLSLHFGNEYTRGLTAYIRGNNTVGIEAHFTNTSILSGYRKGCAIYCPLRQDERIVYVWLRVFDSPSSVFATPAIVIQTTFGRIHTFGSHILPSLIMQNKYKWILLKHDGQVTAFYYENPVSSLAISRLAILLDGNPSLSKCLRPQFASWALPSPPIAGPNAGLFFSSASFSGIKRVELCRVESRCTGLLIHYIDEAIVALGQWHTTSSQHQCIYSAMDRLGSETIYFKIAKFQKHQIVTEISFSLENPETEADIIYQHFRSGQHIAWWFSECSDVISRWEGEYLDIPYTSQMG